MRPCSCAFGLHLKECHAEHNGCRKCELIASGSTIVSSPVLTGMLRMLTVVCVFFCGIFVLPVLELEEELLLLLLFDGVAVGVGVMSYSFRSCPVLTRIVPAARSVLTSSAAFAVISPAFRLISFALQLQAVHVTFVRRLSFCCFRLLL